MGKVFSKKHFRKNLPYVAFAVSTIIVYSRIFFRDFQSQWDDHWVVLNHYTEEGIDRNNVYDILFEFYHGQYSPINQLYYCLLYRLDGYNPFVFYLGGYCLHLCNTFLVYKIFQILLIQSNSVTTAAIFRISFISAFIFGVHPLMVEPVAWISASKVVLYAFFYLVAIWCYLYYLHYKRGAYYFLTLVFFIVSVGAKEQAVTFPLCLVLLDFFLGIKYGNRTWEKVPFFIISCAMSIITIMSQAAVGEGIAAGEEHYSLFQRIVLFSITLSEYLTKILIPINLSYLYPFPFQIRDSVPIFLILYPVLLFTTLVLFFSQCKDRIVIFGALFFLVHIILVSNAIPLSRFAITADRYTYLGNLGIILAISYLHERNRIILSKSYWIILLVVYLSVLTFKSYERVTDWENSETLKKEFRSVIRWRVNSRN